jgi:hypothetical protein
MTVVPLAGVVRNPRFVLLIASCLLAVVLGFLAIPDLAAIDLVSKAGFWFVLAGFVVWLHALWRCFGITARGLHWRRVDWISVGVVGLGSLILLVHETFGFKILMDEFMLLGTSMSMHLDKTALTPLRGNDIQGAFMIVQGMVDKRPLFFPFLLSLLHDFTGYRPENAFILNGALTFVFMGLVFSTGRMMASRAVGWLGVALCAGLPLLAQNCTGGGFELLNLVMILATLLLGARYVERRDASSMTAFCYSGMLLAQVRYESVIYLLPVALVVLWVWIRQRNLTLPWPILIAPLLMVHYPLQHRIFDVRASAWEMFSKPGYTKPFAFDYVPENLEHAVNFFFGRASDQPNSLVLSLFGCIAVPFFLLLLLKRLRTLAVQTPIDVSTAFFSLGFALQFGLMMCYFFKFDDVVTRRLSLPTHLGMVIAVMAIVPQFSKPIVLRSLIAIALVGLLARSIPSMAAHAYSQEYLPGREAAWRRQFIASQPHPDYLMIDNDATLWVTHKISATPTVTARKERRKDIAFHLRNRTFGAVYVFQRYNIDPETSKMSLREGDDLGPAYVLETVIEERLQQLTLSRISRVKEIIAEDGVVAREEAAAQPSTKSRAEIEKARQQFLESFIKQLP